MEGREALECAGCYGGDLVTEEGEMEEGETEEGETGETERRRDGGGGETERTLQLRVCDVHRFIE